MIKMIKGTYGRVTDRGVVAMTPRSPAFSLSEKREAELVAAGVAVKVDPVEAVGVDYSSMDMKELRALASGRGIDTRALRSKKAIIEALEAARLGETVPEPDGEPLEDEEALPDGEV